VVGQNAMVKLEIQPQAKGLLRMILKVVSHWDPSKKEVTVLAKQQEIF
jgi:hypothetical protein